MWWQRVKMGSWINLIQKLIVTSNVKLLQLAHHKNIITLFAANSHCVKLPNILNYDLHVAAPLMDRPERCQRWDSQTPHAHPYTDPAMFPRDATIADAANYCRNPDGGPLPWCYVDYVNTLWMYCRKSILTCGKSVSWTPTLIFVCS